jgi:hypothetical protein
MIGDHFLFLPSCILPDRKMKKPVGNRLCGDKNAFSPPSDDVLVEENRYTPYGALSEKDPARPVTGAPAARGNSGKDK